MEYNNDWSRADKVVNIYDRDIVQVSPYAIGVNSWVNYNKAERDRQYLMQALALGQDHVTPDFETAREDAAAELLKVSDNNTISAAEKLTRMGIPSEEIESLLSENVFDDVESVKNYALEQLSTENAFDEALRDNPNLSGMAVTDDVYYNALVDSAIKDEITASFVARAEADQQALPMTKKAVDILKRFFPYVEAYIDRTSDPLKDKTGHNFWTSNLRNKQREIIDAVKSASTVEEYTDFLNYLDNKILEETKDSFARTEFWRSVYENPTPFTDIGMALDTAVVGGVGKRMFFSNKGHLNSPLKRQISKGNEKAWKSRTNELLKKLDKTPEEAVELEEATKTTMMFPNQNTGLQGVASRTENIKEAEIIDKATVERFKDVLEPVRLSEDEEARAIKNFQDDFKSTRLTGKEKQKVYDYITFNPEKNADGTIGVTVEIGTGSDGTYHFASLDAAESFVKNNTKLVKGEYTILGDSEGFRIRANYTVGAPGITPLEWSQAGKPFKAKWLTRNIFGRKHIPDYVHNMDVTTVRAIESKHKALEDTWFKSINALNDKEAYELDAVIRKGRNERRWFTESQLKDSGLNDKQIQVYNDYHDSNTLAYILNNAGLRRDLVDKGMRDVVVKNDLHYLGKQTDSFGDLTKQSFMNIETGQVYDFGRMSEDMIKSFKDKDMVFFRLNSPSMAPGENVPVKFIFGNRDSFQSLDLPLFVMHDLPGGRQIYSKAAAFMKQPRTVGRVLLKPKTLFGDVNKKALTQQAKEINESLGVYRQYKEGLLTEAEVSGRLNEITAKNRYFRVGSLEDFEKYVYSDKNPKGLLDYRYDVEVVDNGQEMASMRRLRASGYDPIDDDVFVATDSLEDLIEATGQSYWKRGAEPLKTFTGEETPIVDFFDEMKRNINDSVWLTTKKPYTEWYSRRFREMFSDVIDPNDLKQLSDSDLLEYGRILDTGKAVKDKGLRNKINAAKTMQAHWKIIGQVKSDWDKFIDTYMTTFADWLGERSTFERLGLFQRGTKSWETIASFDPQDFARAMAYHLYLGTWNPRQAWLQAMGTNNVLLLEPVNGAKAVGMYMPIRASLATNDAAKLKHLTKTIAKAGGLKEADAVELVHYLKRIGADNAQRLYSSYQSVTGKTMRKVANSSTMFIREAENFNSITSQVTAFLARRTAKPTEKLSDAVLREIVGYGDDLYLNMTRASNSSLQTSSWTRLLAQFSAWGIRNLEAMLGKQFTPAQKARLLMGNLALYGVAGTLGGTGYWVYKGLMDYTPIPEEAAATFQYGLLDSALREAGLPYSLSEAGASMGEGFLGNMIDVLGGEKMEMKDFFASAHALKTLAHSGDIVSGIIGSIGAFVYPSEDKTEFHKHLVKLIKAGGPSSLSNVAKAIYAANTGVLLNSNLDAVAKNVTPWQSVGYALGLGSTSQLGTSLAYDIMADREGTLAQLEKDITLKWRTYMRTNNEDDLRKAYEFVQDMSYGETTPAWLRKGVQDIWYRLIKSSKYTSQYERVISRFMSKYGYTDFIDTIRKNSVLEGTQQWQ